VVARNATQLPAQPVTAFAGSPELQVVGLQQGDGWHGWAQADKCDKHKRPQATGAQVTSMQASAVLSDAPNKP
jgi:hypothetical protein